MRIGELAEATGVSSRSLRYYEEHGLIRSERTSGGWRDFDPSMVDRVVMIQHLFAAGLGSSTIDQVLPCLDAPPEKRNGEMERLFAEQAERLAAKRDIERASAKPSRPSAAKRPSSRRHPLKRTVP